MYRFWGLPKGVNIPPRLADTFCKTKRYAIYFSSFITERAKYPKGKKVISAISLAIIIEPIKVIIINIKKRDRIFPERRTSFLARMVKNLIFRRAQTTARVKNKQDKVLRSK